MLARDAQVQTEPEESEAHRRRRTRGHVTSFGEGRSCDVQDCDTVLSRYNATERCAVHDSDRPESPNDRAATSA